MPVLCPRCELEAESGTAGAACPRCGGKLVTIASGDAPDPLIGTTIDGRFAITARLGRGGMGTVYRARQVSMDREIALKMIDVELERDVGAIKRFFREAKLASSLAHPNTVSVIEFGQDASGRLYLAMELVRGETLSSLVHREHGQSLERVVRMGMQLCDALEAAHALGIVHRDLKLDNAMVLDGGRDLIKVLDFGLARSLIEPRGNATVSGMIAGTPRYLAPEVALRAAEPAPAQDIYALGVMLGELACGHELWTAPTIEELFARKTFGPVDLTGVPPALEPLIQRMLEAEPAGRPTPAMVRASLLAIDPTRRMVVLGELGEDHDKTEVDQPSIATGPTVTALEIRPSALVSIDQAEREPQLAPRATPFGGGLDLPPGGPATGAGTLEVPSAVARLSEPSAPLEVDPVWAEARAAKQAAAAAPPPPPPAKKGSPLAFAIIGVVALGGVGLYAYARTQHHAAVAPDPPRPTVMIHIVSPKPVDVRIDGARGGKTPLTLGYRRNAPAVMITAEVDGQAVSRQVTPDRDQTVDLDPEATR